MIETMRKQCIENNMQRKEGIVRFRYYSILMMLFVFIGCNSNEQNDKNKGKVSMPFEITKSGHLLVTARINGKEANLVLDTAAGRSVIDMGKLEYLKLQTQSVGAPATGLGTSNHETMNITIEELDIGGSKFNDLSLVATDLSNVKEIGGEKGIHGLIGSDILRARRGVIDFDKHILMLDRCDQPQVIVQINVPTEGVFKILSKLGALFR